MKHFLIIALFFLHCTPSNLETENSRTANCSDHTETKSCLHENCFWDTYKSICEPIITANNCDGFHKHKGQCLNMPGCTYANEQCTPKKPITSCEDINGAFEAEKLCTNPPSGLLCVWDGVYCKKLTAHQRTRPSQNFQRQLSQKFPDTFFDAQAILNNAIYRDILSEKYSACRVGTQCTLLAQAGIEIEKATDTLARIHLLIFPLQKDGKRYASFATWVAALKADSSLAASFATAFTRTIDALALANGFRLIFEKLDNQDFHFHLLAGEALGNTIKKAGEISTSHCRNTIVRFAQPYANATTFYTLVQNFLAGRIAATATPLASSESLSFDDARPQAKVHRLVIPKSPLGNFKNGYVHIYQFFKEATEVEITDFFSLILQNIEQKCPAQYARVVTNAGEAANQSQPHLHAHLVCDETHLKVADLASMCDEGEQHKKVYFSNDLKDLIGFIGPNTLVLIDMDQVLINHPHHDYYMRSAGLAAVRNLGWVQQDANEILKAIRDRTSYIIGLTARVYSKSPNDDAAQQLDSLSNNWWSANAYPIANLSNCIKSVCYTNGLAKSISLKEILKELKAKNIDIENILFIDDQSKNIKDIANTFNHLIAFYYRKAYQALPDPFSAW